MFGLKFCMSCGKSVYRDDTNNFLTNIYCEECKQRNGFWW